MDHHTDDPFSYTRLLGPNWMRVLHLHPAESPNDPISCSLEPIEILANSSQPYEAFSYVWRPETPQCNIRCNGKQLQIGANLNKALRRARHLEQTRILWADAICINQKDVKEQSAQVQQMHNIYANASKVLVCIGEEVDDQDAEDCFQVIRETNSFIATQLDLYGTIELIPPFTSETIPSDSKRWDKVRTLMKSTYFTRVWVLQEIGLAQSAAILYGPAELNWAELVELMQWVSMRSDVFEITGFLDDGGVIVNTFESLWRTYDNKPSWRTEMYATRRQGKATEPHSLADVLNNGRYFNATDPRDHVYAFLGHPSASVPAGSGGIETGSQKLVEVDYSKGVDEVYLDTAKAIITKDKHAWTMLSCIDHLPDALVNPNHRPSWVPYWNEGWRVYWLGFASAWYRAGGQDQSAFKALPLPDDSLQLSATQFCNVVWVSKPFESGTLELGETSLPSNEPHPLSVAWQELVQYVHENGSSTSPLFPSTAEEPLTLEDAFSLSLVAGTGLRYSRAANDIANHRELYTAYRQEIEHGHETDHTPSSNAVKFYQRTITDNRRIFFTNTGQVGIGHRVLQTGDVGVVFRGANIPFIVRPTDDGWFRFVGECYVQGVMDGEVMELVDKGTLQEKEIYLV